ncbi:TetR family transcriptional regulator [Niabella yanshanensis]|uniref:TetR family transcriptional regulator n=1 Tax=Niabella yanshanensis TaxID=577386 RepID=A0ABZ0W7X1_9BACT|nr:TetR family transcriptional regulator [Niabella yanshanensis]WQD39291.1 TetR family transcriptional regulator [Niabella yanshanensis]
MTKKEHILEKAEELFSEKGFDATSVRDISKAAGINIAMISYYFGSKEKLMEELFKMRMSAGLVSVKEIAENTDLTTVEKIEKALTGYIERVKTHKSFYRVILAEQATNKNKSVIRFLGKSKESYAQFFETVLAEGYESGSFKHKVDPVLFMTTITGTIMQSLLNKQLYATHHGVKVTEEWIRDVYFDKIKEHLKSITRNILGYESNS